MTKSTLLVCGSDVIGYHLPVYRNTDDRQYIYNLNRKVSKIGAPGKARRRSLDPPRHARKQLDRIYIRDKGICQICFLPCPRSEASRDHIIEVKYLVTREDVMNDDNVILAHILCNLERDMQPKGTVEVKFRESYETNERSAGFKLSDLLSVEQMEQLRSIAHESD